MRVLIPIIATMILSSCQTTAPDRIVSDVCGLFPPIRYSASKDTTETTDQVRKFNAKRDAFCK